MSKNSTKKMRFVLAFFVLLFAFQACCAIKANAADEELLKDLPGQWAEEYEGAGTVLLFEEDGKMSLYFYGTDDGYLYSYEGTWEFEYVPDLNDRMTLLFTETDDPTYTESEYRVECVYEIYAEAWVEDDTLITYLILTPVSCSGVSPFEGVFGDWEVALHREKGPNMQVVNCSNYVSLREKTSTSSKRLAKVPLGAFVLAFPEEGEENGFIRCVYHDEYGYILSEYLQPIE